MGYKKKGGGAVDIALLGFIVMLILGTFGILIYIVVKMNKKLSTTGATASAAPYRHHDHDRDRDYWHKNNASASPASASPVSPPPNRDYHHGRERFQNPMTAAQAQDAAANAGMSWTVSTGGWTRPVQRKKPATK